MPEGCGPQFSPDGYMLALIMDGKVSVRHSRTGEQLLEWHPCWRWPHRLPAPSPFIAASVKWGGFQSRQLHAQSVLETTAGSRLLFSVLSIGD